MGKEMEKMMKWKKMIESIREKKTKKSLIELKKP